MKTSRTRIACGQFASKNGDMAANVATIRLQSGEAAARGAAVAVFPELCLSGYLDAREIPSLAVGMGGEEISALKSAAREAGIALCFGFAEKAGDGRLFNSMAYIDASGAVRAVYRKVHLFGGEGAWAEPGEGYAGFDAGAFRCGMWICYDTRFPEAARSLAMDGVTCALAAAAWLGPAEEWELALRARALDNGMFVAGSALQGGSGPFECHGGSVIADPHGRVLARGIPGRPEVIVADYDPGEVRAFRERLPLLKHRRPGAYGPFDRVCDWPE
jgi:predicted amidohydrolase